MALLALELCTRGAHTARTSSQRDTSVVCLQIVIDGQLGGRARVVPVFRAFTLAPLSMRKRTMGSLPHREAAHRAVVPSGPGSFTSQRADSR